MGKIFVDKLKVFAHHGVLEKETKLFLNCGYVQFFFFL